MSKSFPASETKLTLLREKGIFPRSIYLQKSFQFFALIVSLFLVLPYFFEIADFKEFFLKPESASLNSFVKFYGRLVFLPVVVLVVSFLLGLFQTRFLFSPSLAAFDFSRMKFFSSKGFNLTNIFYHFLLVASFTLLVTYLFYQSLLDFLSISFSFVKNKTFILNLNIKYLLLYLILGLFSYLLNWLFFRKSQMMTREEVEAEHREQQSSYHRR